MGIKVDESHQLYGSLEKWRQ